MEEPLEESLGEVREVVLFFEVEQREEIEWKDTEILRLMGGEFEKSHVRWTQLFQESSTHSHPYDEVQT